jgi:hypothetical protein
MIAVATWEIGWETMVLGIIFLLVLAFVSIVLILREKHSHKTRVGFFIERDRFEDESWEEWESVTPAPPSADEAPTQGDWPIRK